MEDMKKFASRQGRLGGLEDYFKAARAEHAKLSESLKASILDDAISVQTNFGARTAFGVSARQTTERTGLLSMLGGWRPVGAFALSTLVGVGAGLAASDQIASLSIATPTTVTANLAPDIYSGLEEILLEG